MSDRPPPRTAVVHVRVKAALRERIDADAAARNVTASVVVRRILAKHYEGA